MRLKGLNAFIAILGLCALAVAAGPDSPLVQDSKRLPWLMSNTMPMGAEYQLIHEDPATHAVELLVRLPSGYKIATHFHSQDETIFLVKGKMLLGMAGKTALMKPGTYAVVAAHVPHSLENPGWGFCEFVSSFNGPFDVKGLP